MRKYYTEVLNDRRCVRNENKYNMQDLFDLLIGCKRKDWNKKSRKGQLYAWNVWVCFSHGCLKVKVYVLKCKSICFDVPQQSCSLFKALACLHPHPST